MDRKIAVVGLGYVGLPLAVALGKKSHIIGFDISPKKVEQYRQGIDTMNEVTPEDLKAADIEFTSDPASLKGADFIIVAVPTPVNKAHRPDLQPLEQSSKTIGENLSPGTIIVYESTVFPGATEDFCAPIIERYSGLTCGKDFFLGYSPERINPGDKVHSLDKIVKVVAAQTPEILKIVSGVYEMVIDAGVYRAPDIKTAEAAKVIENTQRDLNIALVNELAMIFDRLEIDTLEVLEAAGTKWNFLPFRPGLVGGHCIGVDPYYLTHKAEEVGYHPQVILAGRRINDDMGKFIAQKTVKLLIRSGINPHAARVAILGLTFKENVPDLRNTQVVEMRKELLDFEVEVLTHDPIADEEEALEHYNIQLAKDEELKDLDGVIVAVGHSVYKAHGFDWIKQMLKPGGVIVDVKGTFSADDFSDGYTFWRL